MSFLITYKLLIIIFEENKVKQFLDNKLLTVAFNI